MRIPKYLTLLLLATSLLAQRNLRGPISGFVFDGAERAIRPLVGVPGASYLGEPVVASLDYASVSPDGKLAIAVARERLFLIRGFDSGNTRWLPLENSAAVDRASWAADSDSVAVYTATTGRLRLWSDLGSWNSGSTVRPSPRRRQTVGHRQGGTSGPRLADLGDLRQLGGSVSAMAVTERRDVVVGIDDPAAGGLYLTAPGRAPALIASLAGPGGVALDGERLFVADRSRNEVLEIRSYRDSADISLFAGAALGIADPVAVAISPDRSSLIIASGSAKKLSVFDIPTRAMVTELELDFEPTRLDVLAGGSTYLLNARNAARETLQVFVAGRRPAVYFVPAATAAARTSPTEE